MSRVMDFKPRRFVKYCETIDTKRMFKNIAFIIRPAAVILYVYACLTSTFFFVAHYTG